MGLTGFSAPWWFLLLLVVGAVVALYLAVLRGRRKRTLRFANMQALERVAPATRGWSRHVPPALLIVAMVLLTVCLAGPTAQQRVPRNRATVMLTIDVSLSMNATDVAPNRLRAAQDAAKQFARGLTPGVNLGVVAFAGTSTVLVSPTTSREGAIRAIDNLKLDKSTATGDGILSSLQAIDGFSAVVGGAEGPPPARVVLMSDGQQTTPSRNPYDPRGAFTAAQQAKRRGVPVSTISFGTSYGSVQVPGSSEPVPVEVDDPSMEEVARLAGGEFFKASSGDELKAVYANLGEQIGYESRDADASRPWLALGTLVLLGSAGSSLLIGQRLP